MNRNTKRSKKLLSKQIAQEHAQGHKVHNPPSKRKSPWRGARGQRQGSRALDSVEIDEKILE
jgi:hypothetical protein